MQRKGVQLAVSLLLTACLTVALASIRLLDFSLEKDRTIRPLETITLTDSPPRLSQEPETLSSLEGSPKREEKIPAPLAPFPLSTFVLPEFEAQNRQPPSLPNLEMMQVEFERKQPPLVTVQKEVAPTLSSSTPAPAAPVKVKTTPAAPVIKSSFHVTELDGQPSLLNSPSARFPSSLVRQGVQEGRVTLEVEIATSGRATAKRVVSCSHPELESAARDLAQRSRFTTPRKDGEPVRAVFIWPLVFRP